MALQASGYGIGRLSLPANDDSQFLMAIQLTLDDQAVLLQSLRTTLEEAGAAIEFHETHISWVLITGEFAYKFKKAVRTDFLDFSTLDARQFYCREELRLNRRLAPDLYLDVVAVTGDPEHPVLDDAAGLPIEYAVRMRVFPQQALWTHRMPTGQVGRSEIDQLAEKIAQFHAEAPAAAAHSVFGTLEALRATADDNLQAIVSSASGAEQNAQLRAIETWHAKQHLALPEVFEERKVQGMIRECHGDLHAGNILTIDDHVEVFDCIEFNDALRWIDVINDIAFVCMDLQVQNRPELAARFLSRYLELSGDYDGLAVLGYYRAQRALVRCKVALMRAGQLRSGAQGAGNRESAAHEAQAARYLDYCAASIRPAPAAIMITHGFSGSGKSTVAELLVELAGAVRIRSDVERKRLHGFSALSRSTASPGAGLYDATATHATYDRLCRFARRAAEAGVPVVVDAAFLSRGQRDLFRKLAQMLRVPFFIFDVQAGEATLKERIARRARHGSDPSDADLEILAHQIAGHDPLAGDELAHAIPVDSERGTDRATIGRLAGPVLSALQNARSST